MGMERCMQSIHKRLTRWQIDRPIVHAPWAHCAQAVGASGAAAARGPGLSAPRAGPATALGHDMHAGDLTGELVTRALALRGLLATQVPANQGPR
jgi:hypothetical protein